MTVLTAAEHRDAIEAVETVDLTALSRLSSCRELSRTVVPRHLLSSCRAWGSGGCGSQNSEGECILLYTVDRCRAVYCRPAVYRCIPLYTAVELYTSASGAGRGEGAVYRYTAGIHRVFSTAQNTAFGLATTAETMVGNAGCDAEWVPMTPHASQIVRDTPE